MAKTVCEMGVAIDLLGRLHKAARANVGRIVLGLSKIEQFGKTNGFETVTLKD